MPLSIFSSEAARSFSPFRTILFAVVLLAALKSLIWFYRDTVFPIMPNRLNAIQSADRLDVSAVTIGASYNVDIDFGLLGLTHVPLWLPAADLFEAAEIFEQFLRRGGSPEYVFMVLDANQLYQDNGARRDFKAVNPASRDAAYILTTSSSPFALIDGDIWGWMEANFLPPRKIPLSSNSRAFHAAVMNVLDPPGRSPWAQFEFPQLPDPAGVEEIQQVTDFIMRPVTVAVDQDPEILDRSIAALQRIAVLASGSKVKLIVIAGAPFVPPYEDALENATRAAGLSSIIDRDFALDRAIETLGNAGALVIPRSAVWDRDVDGKRMDWFADNRHLNAHGAEVFTRRLMPFLSLP